MKIKLAVCLEDSIYQERFARCVMNHYANRYEFHWFQDVAQLQELSNTQMDGFLLERSVAEQLGWDLSSRENVLCLDEDNKYREVYSIVEELEQKLSVGGVIGSVPRAIHKKVIGVYSPSVPALQLPFATMISEFLGEKNKVIFLDLQEWSGFHQEGDGSLEDMMMMASTGQFQIGRMQAAVGHMPGWDYVYPLRNGRCLLEGTTQMYQELMKRLESEMGYEIVVLNMGETVINQESVMPLCDRIYWIESKGNPENRREKHLCDELERRGQEHVLHRVRRVEAYTNSGGDGDWTRLREQWRWSDSGGSIRAAIEEELEIG